MTFRHKKFEHVFDTPLQSNNFCFFYNIAERTQEVYNLSRDSKAICSSQFLEIVLQIYSRQNLDSTSIVSTVTLMYLKEAQNCKRGLINCCFYSSIVFEYDHGNKEKNIIIYLFIYTYIFS